MCGEKVESPVRQPKEKNYVQLTAQRAVTYIVTELLVYMLQTAN